MKKGTLLLCMLLCTFRVLYAQNAGFKIRNQFSPIHTLMPAGEADSGNAMKIYVTRDGKTKDFYKTKEIIVYNYNAIKLAELLDQYSQLVNELYDNSKGASTPPFTELVIKAKIQMMDSLKVLINDLTAQQDSLCFEYTKDLLTYKKASFGFGPRRSRAFFDILYGDEGKRFRALSNTGLNFGNNTGSLFSELVSGNLGLFRVSLGTMISTNNNENEEQAKEEEAYQRLVTYGGNTVLNFEYPLAYLHSANNQYNLLSRALVKGTADLPAFGTSTEKWAGSGSVGIDLYADASLDNKNNALRFFANANFNKIYGTDVFRDNLGINSTNFFFGQFSAGLVFMENFKISFMITSFGSEPSLRNRRVVIGGQVLR